MEKVKGIILILSCNKHKNTRLKMFGPKKNIYNGYKVVKVIGDLFLDRDYVIKEDIMYVKCEDSYLHLLKKLALSIKYLNEIFIIEEGVLRCGDDLNFDENILNKFLISKKYDFFGQSTCGKNYICNNRDALKNTEYSTFMLKYYANHVNELDDPKHGIHLSLNELKQYLIKPKIWGPHGIIFYLSNKSCKIIVDTFEKINYNIFHLDKFSNSFPYIIEDVGVSFIMYYNNINFINSNYFFDNANSIAKHTNMFK
tara:strand:+ start:12 stop:776 length:765 start_codon:yes stop_codon:yes gene_type:complete